MPIPLAGGADFGTNQALNMILHNLTSDPGAIAGRFYYNSNAGVKRPRWSDGTSFFDIYPFTAANTANTGVQRDGSGNFAAGTITAALTGNASTATALQTPRAISISGKATATGVNFDGSGAIALSVTALSVALAEIAIPNGMLMAGGAGGTGTAIAKSSILHSDLGAPAAHVDWNQYRLTGLADPVGSQDAVNLQTLQAYSFGFDLKNSVRVINTSGIPAYTRSGNVITASSNGVLPTQDGVTLVAGDSIALAIGTSIDNGIYTVTQVGTVGTPFILTRRGDADSSAEVTSGMFFFVEDGTNYQGSQWSLTTKNPITLNGTALTISQYNGLSQITVNYPLSKSGNTISLLYDNVTVKVNGSNQVYVDPSQISIGGLKADLTALTIVGNPSNATAGPSAIQAAADGQVMRRSGTTLGFGAMDLSSANSTVNQLPVGKGGTGFATATLNGVLFGNNTSPLGFTSAGTQYQVLQAGVSGVPTFGALDLSQAAATTNVLPISRGGNGSNSFAQNAMLIGPSTGGAGTPTIRTLVAADIPNLSGSYLSLGGGTLTGTLNGTAAAFSGTVTAATLTGNIQGNALSLSQVTTALGGNPALSFSQVITGDGTTTAWTVTHNLNTKALAPAVSLVASPYTAYLPDVSYPTVNTATFNITPAPTTGQQFLLSLR